jgi:hypothetical protein
MITNRRLRWVPNLRLANEAALRLDDVTGVSEEVEGHRYAIALEHHPVRRLHWVPAHTFLWFRWGNDERIGEFRRTRLAFSRPNTAVALRAELARRGRL